MTLQLEYTEKLLQIIKHRFFSIILSGLIVSNNSGRSHAALLFTHNRMHVVELACHLLYSCYSRQGERKMLWRWKHVERD